MNQPTFLSVLSEIIVIKDASTTEDVVQHKTDTNKNSKLADWIDYLQAFVLFSQIFVLSRKMHGATIKVNKLLKTIMCRTNVLLMSSQFTFQVKGKKRKSYFFLSSQEKTL